VPRRANAATCSSFDEVSKIGLSLSGDRVE